MPPEAEENGAHAQERKANCSLQHAKSQNAARMLIATGGHTVDYGTRGGEVGLLKKLDFHYSEENKNHYSEICILMHVNFLIITKNSGGLAAMHLIHDHGQKYAVFTCTTQCCPNSFLPKIKTGIWYSGSW